MGREDEEVLDPEYAIPDDILRRKIREALDDPRPSIPAKEVFERLLKRAERKMKRNARRSSR